MIPALIAHRGRYLGEPENTVESLEALPPWVDGVEIDVRLTSDDVPILMHDSTVDRTTNGSGSVDSFTLAQIQNLDAGKGQQVPRLVDYLDAVVVRNTNAPQGQRPISVILVDMIGDTVGVSEAYAIVDAHSLRDSCLFMFRFLTSTSGPEALRVLDANIPLGTFSLPPDEVATQLGHMDDLDATIVYTGGDNWLTNPQLISAVRDAGFQFGVSTAILTAVVSARDVAVDGVISDATDRLGWWYADDPQQRRAVVVDTIAGSYWPVFEARVLTSFQSGDDPDGTTIPILDGDVQFDGTADVWSTLSLSTAGVDEDTGRSLRPRRPGDLLAPWGNEVWIRYGLDLGSEVLWVPLGYFRITDAEQPEAPDGPVRITGQDRMRGLIRAQLLRPRVFQPDATVGEVVANLVEDVYPDAVVGFDDATFLTPIGRQLVVERDRYAALREIGDSYGKVLFWDGLGLLRFEDMPDPGEVAWEVRSGAREVLIQPSVALSDRDSINAMVVTGQGVTGLVSPARGIAVDRAPTSPTRFDGPTGQQPEFFESPVVLDDAQATAAAIALLRRRIGQAHTAQFRATVNPLLRPWQAVRTTMRDGSRDLHVMQRYTIPLTTRAAADGSTREQTHVNVQALR